MEPTIDKSIELLEYLKTQPMFILHKDEALDIAVDIMRKYQIMQAEYNARLKADMVAMLEELVLQIDELSFSDEEPTNITQDYIDEVRAWEYGKKGCKKLIKQKIDVLKENKDGSN